MTDSDSPLFRPTGLRTFVRGFLALAAVIAIGAAVAEGHYGLAIGGVLFLVIAVILGYKARRVRQELGTDSPARDAK